MPSRFKTRAHFLALVVVLVNCNDVLHAASVADPTSASAGARDAEIEAEKFSLAHPPSFLADTSRWSFSFESMYTFEDIPNPWFIVFLHAHRKNFRDYKFATQILSARYRLTDTCGPLFLRGNLEMSIGPTATAIVSGPESYFAGGVSGFRYNFVQPRTRLIPYLELRVGVGASDSKRVYKSLQADLTCTYLLGAGLRYDVNHRLRLTLGVVDQHLSNAFFANPDYGIDSLGVSAGMELRY